MKVLVTLGYTDQTGEGSIVEVDLGRRESRVVVSFTPPPSLCVPEKGFTGAAWLGAPGRSDLVVCGFNALYRFDGPTLAHRATLHRPDMNDLHSVFCDGVRLFVTNTGLDAVDVYDVDGSFLGGYRTEPSWLLTERWAGRTPSRSDHHRLLHAGWTSAPLSFGHEASAGDYYAGPPEAPVSRRKIRDYVHPNHVAVVGDQFLVTRLADRRVVDIARLQTVLEAPAPPHDGELDGDRFWITCVDGRVLAYSVECGRVTQRLATEVDASSVSGCYGWCRGLLVSDELLVVGFTEIRRTPRYPWRDHPFEGTSTALVVLDKGSLRPVARMAIGPNDRQAKIFSIVRAQ